MLEDKVIKYKTENNIKETEFYYLRTYKSGNIGFWNPLKDYLRQAQGNWKASLGVKSANNGSYKLKREMLNVIR